MQYPITAKTLSAVLVGGLLLLARTARADDDTAESSGKPAANPDHAPQATGDETWNDRPATAWPSLFGARITGFGASSEKNAFGAGVGFTTAGYTNKGWFSMRGTSNQALGSSNHGLEGLYTGDLGFGVRVPLNARETHGPIARIGLRGYMMGNQRVWLSMFEIPSAHVGYQIMEGPYLFDVAARGGLVLDGRHTHYGELQGFEVLEKRVLGHPSWEYGGHLAMGYGPVRLEAEYMRIAVDDRIATPLDTWSVAACVRSGSVGGCLDYKYWKADIPRTTGTIEPMVVGYGGVTIGFWTP